MKIWFDILTPKQLLFFEPIVRKLRKNHSIVCTSRHYREVSQLAKIRNFNLILVGKHGGTEKDSKLNASLSRMVDLLRVIKRYSPDITISFCSPEASRISYGLSINHIAFSDSPHATAVMRLSIPLVQKLFIPWIIPKKEFTRYGINSTDILHYKAIDAGLITKRKIVKDIVLPFINKQKKTILIRVEEDQAAYSSRTNITIPIIKAVVREFHNENVIVLSRYPAQTRYLNKIFGNKIKILKMLFDGKLLLNHASVFIGSGGTMTAESALLGVPTISYNAVPNLIEKYLVRKKLVRRETDPKRVVLIIKHFFRSPNTKNKMKAMKILKSMEDPYKKLVKIINSMS